MRIEGVLAPGVGTGGRDREIVADDDGNHLGAVFGMLDADAPDGLGHRVAA